MAQAFSCSKVSIEKSLFLLCCFSLVGAALHGHCGVCGVGPEKKPHKHKEVMLTVSAEQLKEQMEDNKELLVVNVLSKESYKDCHIKGSINAPLAELDKISHDWAKDREIVVYCASETCSASKKAWEQLHKLGFAKVSAYEGGTKEWKEKGFPTEGACQADYLKK